MTGVSLLEAHMSDQVRSKVFVGIILTIISAAALWALWKEHSACNAEGGTLVRTLFWVACVDDLR